ncbi:MAG: hypothetical protein EOO28_18165 [Comamonadaceae bacterium]|nr:MAG: hypothetical protein EOO28_18165 [Comamonadaceae bacterium]
MFSDHLRKVNSGNNGLAGKLLLAAGGLVIVGQLGAVAMVADGQVKKAEQRASLAMAEQVAVQQCLESSVGATRHSCLQQTKGGGDSGFSVTASLNAGGGYDLYSSQNSSVPPGAPMLVPVNFMAR